MTFAARAREARLNAAMETLRDPEATAHDVAQARAAIGAPTTDLRKLTDAELTVWIHLREKLAGRAEGDVNRAELARHAQDLADELAAPKLPGCRRCRDFTDEDLGDLRAVTPLALPPGEPTDE